MRNINVVDWPNKRKTPQATQWNRETRLPKRLESHLLNHGVRVLLLRSPNLELGFIRILLIKRSNAVGNKRNINLQEKRREASEKKTKRRNKQEAEAKKNTTEFQRIKHLSLWDVIQCPMAIFTRRQQKMPIRHVFDTRHSKGQSLRCLYAQNTSRWCPSPFRNAPFNLIQRTPYTYK